MKKSLFNILSLLLCFAALCLSITVWAEERPSVTAKLEQSYDYVDFENHNGLEYYSIRNSRAGTYDSYYGIADINGKVIIPCIYSHIFPQLLKNEKDEEYYSDTYYWCLKTFTDTYGVADKKGKIIIPCKYGFPHLINYRHLGVFDDQLSKESYGFVFAMGEKAVFNEKGKELIPTSRGYTYISPQVNMTDGVKYFYVEKGEKQGLKNA